MPHCFLLAYTVPLPTGLCRTASYCPTPSPALAYTPPCPLVTAPRGLQASSTPTPSSSSTTPAHSCSGPPPPNPPSLTPALTPAHPPSLLPDPRRALLLRAAPTLTCLAAAAARMTSTPLRTSRRTASTWYPPHPQLSRPAFAARRRALMARRARAPGGDDAEQACESAPQRRLSRSMLLEAAKQAAPLACCTELACLATRLLPGLLRYWRSCCDGWFRAVLATRRTEGLLRETPGTDAARA